MELDLFLNTIAGYAYLPAHLEARDNLIAAWTLLNSFGFSMFTNQQGASHYNGLLLCCMGEAHQDKRLTGQIMLAGPREQLERAEQIFKRQQIAVQRLSWHSELYLLALYEEYKPSI